MDTLQPEPAPVLGPPSAPGPTEELVRTTPPCWLSDVEANMALVWPVCHTEVPGALQAQGRGRSTRTPPIVMLRPPTPLPHAHNHHYCTKAIFPPRQRALNPQHPGGLVCRQEIPDPQ